MTIHFKIQNAHNAPVVALHSSASGSAQWKALIAQLQDRNEVIAIDLPGYGNGPKRAANADDMAGVANPVLDEIKKLNTPVHLVGHSFGGAVAIKIALMRPDLVKSLTLYEPAAFHILRNGGPSDQQLLTDFRRVEQVLNTSMSIGRNDLGMEKFINFWNDGGAWQGMPETLRENLAAVATTVSSDFKSSLGETWVLSDLSNLPMPTLMLMGMDSPAVAQRTATLIAEHIPGAELAMLPGLGHMAPVQDPEWVNPRIQQHIARVEKSAAHVRWPHRVAA